MASFNVQTREIQSFAFALSAAELDTIQKLKKRLISYSILALFGQRQRCMVDTDACGDHIEYARLQQQPNTDELTVRSWSRSVAAPKKMYSTTGKKRLAVLKSILLT